MNIRKSITLLTLGILAGSALIPSIAFAAEASQSNIPASTQSSEPTQNKDTSVPSQIIEMTHVDAAQINPIISGDKIITGTLPRYGITDSGEKIKLDYSDAVSCSINSQLYNQFSVSNNQMFNYSISVLNDNYYTFSFTLPNSLSFIEGDKLANFVIPATLPLEAPQLSQKLTGEIVVGKAQIETGLKAHNSVIYVRDIWKPEDNYDGGIDSFGSPIEYNSLTDIKNNVDTSKPGVYSVTYYYEAFTPPAKRDNSSNNDSYEVTAQVTVVDKSAILVHDSTLTVGDTWTAQDNFDSALNKKGDKIPFDQIKVDGTVDTSKAGTYKVTYSYDETATPQVMKAEVGASHRGTTTVTATITVKDKAPVDPGNPGEPTSPITPSQPDKPSGSGNTNTNTSGNTTVNVSNYGEDSKTSNKTLPETGEENNSSFIVYGLGILAALLGFITYRGIRRKN